MRLDDPGVAGITPLGWSHVRLFRDGDGADEIVNGETLSLAGLARDGAGSYILFGSYDGDGDTGTSGTFGPLPPAGSAPAGFGGGGPVGGGGPANGGSSEPPAPVEQRGGSWEWSRSHQGSYHPSDYIYGGPMEHGVHAAPALRWEDLPRDGFGGEYRQRYPEHNPALLTPGSSKTITFSGLPENLGTASFSPNRSDHSLRLPSDEYFTEVSSGGESVGYDLDDVAGAWLDRVQVPGSASVTVTLGYRSSTGTDRMIDLALGSGDVRVRAEDQLHVRPTTCTRRPVRRGG